MLHHFSLEPSLISYFIIHQSQFVTLKILKDIVKFIVLSTQIGYFWKFWVVASVSLNFGDSFYILCPTKFAKWAYFFFCWMHFIYLFMVIYILDIISNFCKEVNAFFFFFLIWMHFNYLFMVLYSSDIISNFVLGLSSDRSVNHGNSLLLFLRFN